VATGVVEGAEQCDDGGTADLDGCSRTCRVENTYVFAGTAEGGSVEFVVDGVSVSITTSPGQSAADVAAAMALAIEANAALAALGVVSQSTFEQLVVAGEIDSVSLADSGLAATVPIAPWVSIALLLLVGATGFALLSRANVRSA
jgi:cysteine-rich repeat protein